MKGNRKMENNNTIESVNEQRMYHKAYEWFSETVKGVWVRQFKALFQAWTLAIAFVLLSYATIFVINNGAALFGIYSDTDKAPAVEYLEDSLYP